MRKTELDSLRGLAAFAVLLYHATAASLWAFFDGAALRPVTGFWNNVFTYSPLRIISAGPEAVWLFFALSGFVLVRSAWQPGYRWDAYYPSRIVRLYLPVLGAVALTALVFALVPHVPKPDFARMVAGLPGAYTIEMATADATLITGTSIANVPLWSLQWEVLYSLLLPLGVLVARRHPRLGTTLAVLSALVSVWTGSLILLYLPMFVIGSVLGYHWEAIAARLDRMRVGPVGRHVAGAVATVLAVCLLTIGYWLNSAMDHNSYWSVKLFSSLFVVAKLAGIVLLLAAVMLWGPLRSFLRLRPLVALGSISFSLYLVHGPLVIGLLFLLGTGRLTLLLQVVVSVVVAILFYVVVEKNAHRLSRRVAQHIRTEQPPAPPVVVDGASAR